MKQRVKLAQAIAHDPPLLLLDEPTNGLDPKGRRHMLDLVHDLGHAQGKHLILCSHQLPDVERTCDHVVVLNRGHVIERGSIADLTRSDEHIVRVRVGGEEAAFERALAAEGMSVSRTGPGAFRIAARIDDADSLFELAGANGAWIESVEDLRSSLEDVFLRLLRESEGVAQ